MSGKMRFLIGGIGALMPVLLLLLTFDYENNFQDSTFPKMFGYFVRVASLFLLGGFIAWMHKTETEPIKSFEVGLGAPALIAGLITSHSLAPQKIDFNPKAAAVYHMEISDLALRLVTKDLFMFSSAHAESTPTPGLKRFLPKYPSTSAEFLSGLVGTQQSKIYYVVTGSYKDYADAKKQADKINRAELSFTAEVYAPFGKNPNYAVVVGANLSRIQAEELRAKSISAGISKSTYLLWAIPSQSVKEKE